MFSQLTVNANDNNSLADRGQGRWRFFKQEQA